MEYQVGRGRFLNPGRILRGNLGGPSIPVGYPPPKGNGQSIDRLQASETQAKSHRRQNYGAHLGPHSRGVLKLENCVRATSDPFYERESIEFTFLKNAYKKSISFPPLRTIRRWVERAVPKYSEIIAACPISYGV